MRQALRQYSSFWEPALEAGNMSELISDDWFTLAEDSKRIAQKQVQRVYDQISSAGWAIRNILLNTQEQARYSFVDDWDILVLVFWDYVQALSSGVSASKQQLQDHRSYKQKEKLLPSLFWDKIIFFFFLMFKCLKIVYFLYCFNLLDKLALYRLFWLIQCILFFSGSPVEGELEIYDVMALCIR